MCMSPSSELGPKYARIFKNVEEKDSPFPQNLRFKYERNNRQKHIDGTL